MEGGSVHDLMSKNKKLQTKDIVRIAVDVAEGVKFMNDHGVAYRNLNTQRILLDKHVNACLGDMGIVNACRSVGEAIDKIILLISRKRPGRNMAFKLSSELVDAAKGSGDAIRKKEETRRMVRQIELLHIFVNLRTGSNMVSAADRVISRTNKTEWIGIARLLPYGLIQLLQAENFL
ncbi:unnamed protein product [Lupinus luteus]|uniref:Protein kinase domain-containing protein n=1 Tax=Lupinus luteus TaxID=3873 RepID=A0AAV1W127_LUPLU